jgi:hypothetical protein
MATHETKISFQKEKIASDKSFGLVFACFFFVVGAAPLLKHHPLRLWALVLSCLFFLVSFFSSGYLHPLNKIWNKVGLLLGKIIAPIAVGVLFFIIITPLAIMSKLLGKDPLRLKWEANADSYWIKCQPSGPSPESMMQQF